MTTRMTGALACAVLLPMTLACSDAVSPVSGDVEAEGVPNEAPYVFAYGQHSSGEAPFSDTDLRDLRITYARLRAEASALADSDAPLAEVDTRVRRFLTSHRDFPLSGYLEQYVAVVMLRVALASDGGASTDAIEFYASVLLDNGSPEADLLNRSLRRLRDRWDTARIHTAAREAAENALAWAERLCPDCGPAAKSTRHPAHVDLKRRDILHAVEDLQQLAGP